MRRATESAVSSWKPFTSTTPAPSSRPSPYFFQRSTSDSSRLANSRTNLSARALSTPGEDRSQERGKPEVAERVAKPKEEARFALSPLGATAKERPPSPAHAVHRTRSPSR